MEQAGKKISPTLNKACTEQKKCPKEAAAQEAASSSKPL